MKLCWNDARTGRRMLAVPAVYFVCYMTYFQWLESWVRPKFWISCELDAYIPFCEAFILPYLAWFLLVPAVFLYFHRRDPEQYIYLCRTVLLGLTICLALYTLFPNGQLLRRPIPRDNLLCRLVEYLRRTDTPTNVCPSIHVFVSMTVAIALGRSRAMARQPRVRAGLIVLCVLICMATVCLKQHSLVDVVCGAALCLGLDLMIRKSTFGMGLLCRICRAEKRTLLRS